MLKFSAVAQTFSELESTAARLEMTDILSELFKKTSASEIDKLVYLMQGILAPPYEDIDVGIGERFAISAIAASAGYSVPEVDKHYKKSGDLGLTAQSLLSKKKQMALSTKDMDITFVYNSFLKIAKASGTGSQELKIKLLTEMLNNSTPIEARFIIRFVLGRLRLGVGDPTILDALSYTATGDKSLREELERAYNVCSDMGFVAKVFFEAPKKIKGFKVTPFKPLMPALAERLSTPEEIIEKIGKCGVERKYDGFRLQCHKKGNQVELYSRKLEKMTHMFPDVVAQIQSLKAKEIIFEGEALAYDNKRKRYFSFQQTMHRRRKYGIDKMKKELPLNIFCFDILYLDGKDMTGQEYKDRRKTMKKLFPKGILLLSESEIIDDSTDLEKIFSDSINKGLEGIMAKDLSAQYTAGKRKFAWIKLKKSYGKSVDTIDAVIVGYFLGKGHRAEFKFGGLLVAVYNPDRNALETIAKIGSGYTEEEMMQLQNMLTKIKTKAPPKNLDFRIEPDFWVEPKYVVEVAFDELTRSPTHTCAIEDEKGLALRFPRMVKMREEKSTKEATTSDEVVDMFELQRGK
jgi:DNA ligase-1